MSLRIRTLGFSLALAVSTLAILSIPGSAVAATGPLLQIGALANTSVEPGGELQYQLDVHNVGDQPTNGEQVVLEAVLPAGMTAIGLDAEVQPQLQFFANCTAGDGSSPVLGANSVKCTTNHVFGGPAEQGRSAAPVLDVQIAPGAHGVLSVNFRAFGGGSLGTASTYRAVEVTTASPSFGAAAFDQLATEGSGEADTQAAAHPFAISTAIDFQTHDNPEPVLGPFYPIEPVKDAIVDLPPGAVGVPTHAARCTAAQLASGTGLAVTSLCPITSQVGTVAVSKLGLELGEGATYSPIPLFNMIPPAGVPAEFGFNLFGSIVVLIPHLRSSSDYGLTVATTNIPTGLALAGTTVDFWGDPADPAHDAERACRGDIPPWQEGPTVVTPGSHAAKGTSGEPCMGEYSRPENSAFLRDPTSCSGPTRTSLYLDSWFHPGAYDSEGEPLAGDPSWQTGSIESHEAPGYPLPEEEEGVRRWGVPVGNTGCEEVPFEPSISVQPTTHLADSPTGLDVDLEMPQLGLEEPDAIAQADVKGAVVTQPIGTRVNPAAGEGLSGCSEQQIGFIGGSFPMPNPTHFTIAQPSCPDSSKIGTVEIESPLMPDKMEGSIYQARQDENPFDSTLAFYAVAYADGVMIKLPAEVKTDPQTGQVSTIFRDSPQLPFEHYKLHFFSGPRAPLITPPTCGNYTTHTSFSGWANPQEAAHPEDSFQITEGPGGSPCANTPAERPFKPSFSAGTASPIAGAFSPFVLKLSREDGSQELSGLEATLPKGLIAALKGVPYCPEAQIAAAGAASGLTERAAPSCPAASKVGVIDAAAGAGPTPLHNPGTVYLAGPYKGAPLSFAIVTPAVAGPLDLGTVVVRAALRIDPETVQVTAVSDPLPTRILKGGDGFPLDLRTVTVQVERPAFTLNPTSCNPMAISAIATSTEGAPANLSNRFQVGECGRLGFKPSLALKLSGGTKRAKHPALKATLNYPTKGSYANIAKAVVALPHSEFLDQSHIGTVCTRVQFAANQCPAKSIYGHAKAITPLLDQPLEGPVYLRSSSHKLPDLVADLRGQIHVVLDGRIDSVNGGIRTTFQAVPDAPVSRFTLTMQGAKKGLLQNSTNICASTNRATANFDGQNGKIADSRPVLKAAGCGGAKGRGKGSRGGRGR